MKKLLTVLLALAMILSLVACGAKKSDGESSSSSGKIKINVLSFTDELKGMIDKFLELNPDYKEKVEINSTVIATTDGLYEPALDQALAAGDVDLYAAESAFVLKYTQGDASAYAATYEDLGIDVAALTKAADIAQYTIDIGTRPSDNKVVGLGYQATGGAFIYRRSIAKDVWGSDDPTVVAEKIGAGSGNWDQFFKAAEELKAKGYKIVSGDGDIWHAVENASSTGWIVDGKLTIPAEREAFLDLSKTLKDNGYHSDTQDWTDAWYADMKQDSKVLGFYGPAWLINYTIGAQNEKGADNSSYGDWGVCVPNLGFFWGGTWVLAGKGVVGTEKQDFIRDFIKWVTLDCDQNSLQYKWANGTLNGEGGTKDSVASGTVMAMSDGSMEFCGGQNVFDVFVPANAYANGKCLTQYDQKINDQWRAAVRQYTAGTLSRDDAIKAFKEGVKGLGLDITVE